MPSSSTPARPQLSGVMAALMCAALCVLGVFPMPESAAAADALQLEAKIPLGAVVGRIDHLAIDLDRHLLYVAELGSNSVGVVDVKRRELVRTVTGFSEPQGVLYLRATDHVYVANGGDGTLHILNGGDLSLVQKIELGGDADNIRLDPTTGQVVVGYGGGALAFVDPTSRSKIVDIPLPGHPESFRFDATGSRIFVNIPDAAEIAVVDRASGAVKEHWRQTDTSNFAMMPDEAGKHILVAFRSPAVIGVFDWRTGNLRQRLATCEDIDDLFVDARRQQIYVICGAGAIDIFALRAGSFAGIGRLTTAPGARTGLFVPELDELFVAVPATTNEPAAVWVFGPRG